MFQNVLHILYDIIISTLAVAELMSVTTATAISETNLFHLVLYLSLCNVKAPI